MVDRVALRRSLIGQFQPLERRSKRGQSAGE